MIIVSDTTPFRYLIEIEAIEILSSLFGQVIIPPAVAAELQHPKTPPKIKAWIQAPPSWLEIRQANLSLFTPLIPLGKGETEVIALAIELQAEAILMDERAGRSEALRVGLLIFPTLTILEAASARSLLDLHETLDRLSKTSFRASPELYRATLERARQAKEVEE